MLLGMSVSSMGVWEGVAMDSLKFYTGLLYPTLLRPAGEPRLKQPHSRFWDGLPTAVFYPFGHPSPYASGFSLYRPPDRGIDPQTTSIADLRMKARKHAASLGIGAGDG
jgi:hypothetical protein